MHHILLKCMKPTCLFYHAQAKELDLQYTANVCRAIALGLDCICRHGAVDIQMPDPVGSKHKRDNLRQNSGHAKRRYLKSRHQLEVLQGGGGQKIWNNYPAK